MKSTANETAQSVGGKWQPVEPMEKCREALHKQPFRLTHALAGHPLFSIEALIKVAQAAAKRPGDLYADAGDVKLTDKWGHIPMPDRPVEEVLHRIEHAGAWIIMKHVETDPAYAAVLGEFVNFVRALSLPNQQHLLRNPEMLVLITSPNRVTSFHFDAEVNFLIQIQGSKDVWVCDPVDHSIVTEEEIERYYAGHHNAGTYKPGVEDRALHFDLQPGQAIHIPTHGAHWVKNGNNVSVSVSLNFELPPSMYRYPALANYGLRRLGLRPAPVDGMTARYSLKSLAGGMAYGVYSIAKRTRSIFKS